MRELTIMSNSIYKSILKEINFSFAIHSDILDIRDYQKMIVFSLERVIFVNDYEFYRLIRIAIKDYLK